jgi:hypothetical protein
MYKQYRKQYDSQSKTTNSNHRNNKYSATYRNSKKGFRSAKNKKNNKEKASFEDVM